MAEPQLAVEVDGVVKRFGRLRALDGVTLRVRRGEVYGLAFCLLAVAGAAATLRRRVA